VRSSTGATAGSQSQHLYERCAAGTTPNTENEKDTTEARHDFSVEGGAGESVTSSVDTMDATELRMEGLPLEMELLGRQLSCAFEIRRASAFRVRLPSFRSVIVS
jgi:hypothetical protein